MTKKAKAGKKESPKALDYLQWVGAAHYENVDEFIDEAERLGVSKRIGKYPTDLILGESRIFLAHDDGLVGEGFVFGYYVPNRLEYLTVNEIDIPARFVDIAVWVSDWSEEEWRGCGFREEGLYLATEAILSGGEFVVFDRPRSLEAFDPGRPHFRGLAEIDYGTEMVEAEEDAAKREAAGVNIDHWFKVPPSRIQRKTRKITDEELIQRMEDGQSKSFVAREIALETGSKKSSVLYHYRKLMKAIEEGEETDA
jgi:hypothetical protein